MCNEVFSTIASKVSNNILTFHKKAGAETPANHQMIFFNSTAF
jgi:hypothetical protein